MNLRNSIYSIHTFTCKEEQKMDIYKSARRIVANGKLQKNKGIMLIGGVGATVEFKGISGGDWVSSTCGVTGAANTVTVIPVSVYGITLSAGAIAFELN